MRTHISGSKYWSVRTHISGSKHWSVRTRTSGSGRCSVSQFGGVIPMKTQVTKQHISVPVPSSALNTRLLNYICTQCNATPKLVDEEMNVQQPSKIKFTELFPMYFTDKIHATINLLWFVDFVFCSLLLFVALLPVQEVIIIIGLIRWLHVSVMRTHTHSHTACVSKKCIRNFKCCGTWVATWFQM